MFFEGGVDRVIDRLDVRCERGVNDDIRFLF